MPPPSSFDLFLFQEVDGEADLLTESWLPLMTLSEGRGMTCKNGLEYKDVFCMYPYADSTLVMDQ